MPKKHRSRRPLRALDPAEQVAERLRRPGLVREIGRREREREGWDSFEAAKRGGPAAARSARAGDAPARALRLLGEVGDRRRALAAELEGAVLAARRSGLSWSVIGSAVGVTGEGLRRRFGGSVAGR